MWTDRRSDGEETQQQYLVNFVSTSFRSTAQTFKTGRATDSLAATWPDPATSNVIAARILSSALSSSMPDSGSYSTRDGVSPIHLVSTQRSSLTAITRVLTQGCQPAVVSEEGIRSSANSVRDVWLWTLSSELFKMDTSIESQPTLLLRPGLTRRSTG